MPGSTSPSTSKSYGVNKAAVGAAAGAGVGGAILLMTKLRHPSVTGCVGPDGKTLMKDNGQSFPLLSGPLTPGERLVLSTKKSRDTSGTEGFDVLKVRKDLGRCEHEAKSNNATTARR